MEKAKVIHKNPDTQKLINIGILIVLEILVTSIMLPISPMFQEIPGRDSGVFLYIGSKLLDGKIPYRDVWDHKPPIIYFIDALGLFIGKGSRWGVWFIEWLSMSLSALVGYSFLFKYFGKLPATFATISWLFALPRLIQGGNLTTEYSILIQVLILIVFMDHMKSNNRKLLVVLGMLSAFLFFLKQNLIGLAFSIVIFLFISCYKDKKWKILINNMSSFLLGGIIISSIVVMYFYINNALADFWDAAFLYNFAYTSNDIRSLISSILVGMKKLTENGLVYFALLGWLLSINALFINNNKTQIRENSTINNLLLLGIIDLPIELVLSGLSGRSYSHYYMSNLIIFSLLISYFIYSILKIMDFNQNNYQTKLINSIILFGLVFFTQVESREYYFPFSSKNTPQKKKDALQIIEDETSTNDYVLILGAETALNFQSSRDSPTKYAYQYPLIEEDYVTEAKLNEFYSEINNNKPKLIIDTTQSNGDFTRKDLSISFLSEFYSNEYFRGKCTYYQALEDWDFFICE